ncbi:hypothetical protein Tco_0877032 [Tanacetum coccineum]|uniref:Uncharacterized protein n=1 Tax=Tanacetum coccineum TaxID=301880 RepID=A0ABQ5BU78_9ASTR
MIGDMEFIEKYMLETTFHQQEIQKPLTKKKLLQTQEVQSNTVQALNVDSVVMKNTCSGKENSNLETAFSNSIKESNLDSETKDVHAIKYKMSKAKERCMTYQMTDKYFVEYTRIEVKQCRDTLLQHMGNVKKSIAERTRHQRQYDKRVNKRQIQMQENKVDLGKALDVDLVVMESSGTKSRKHDTSSKSGNATDANNANG